MGIFKQIIKILVISIPGLLTLGNFIFNNEFTLEFVINGVKAWEWNTISQLIIVFGFGILISVLTVVGLNLILGIKRPSRDGFDLVAEVLLPEEQLSNSESKHKKRLSRYYLINIAFLIVIFGVVMFVIS